ncbi:hypothetical protein CVD28_04715 [Bacillus sp. M6-12]|uniref:hypothetical protein n=1 Tax=Bacillus sp. M6-12 TaxID=2054166 RepID=UPI000C785215|nr:hypothetical protein [Bacillus sp. M6-12]PLS19718.1 hypothetical protein CVD28_04715 [Bacillus sp. M6-12]
MAKPPVTPLKTEDGKEMSYFEMLVRMSYVYLKKDGINLNFAGYTDTLIDYANMQEHEVEKAWRLTKELNAWSEYFSSIANLIQKVYLDAETDKIEVQATSSIEADSVKVANGERLSNKDPRVIDARKKRNTLKAFHDELEAKIKFLERGYYHCKATCEWANKSTPSPMSSQQPQR